MQKKKASELYQSYLSRVKSNYDDKRKRALKTKGGLHSVGYQLYCLPEESRKRVTNKIELGLNKDKNKA